MAKSAKARSSKKAVKRTAKRTARKPAAKKKVSWLPAGAHLVTPYLSVRDAGQAIDFYKRAFGAREKTRMEMPGGKIGHAEIRVGGAEIFLADEFDENDTKSPATLGGSSVSIHLYVANVDRAFDRAVAAGAKPLMPPADMFWGDRFGKLQDPFGHSWSMSQHKEDLTPREIRKRMAAAFPPPAS